MIPPSLKPGSYIGRDKFDGTRKTPRPPEKGRRACRKNGAMLQRGRFGVGRSSVARNPRPAETQRPLGTLRSYEHSNDLPQVAKLRCCATELPAPASSCRHTCQVYCSDLLRVFQRRLVAAARMQKQAWSDPQPPHAPICTEHAEDILGRPTSRIPQRAGNLRERVTCV